MKTLKWVAAIAGAGILTWMGLPKLLHMLGLHPQYRGPRCHLPGKRALIVTTSHGTLDENGRATGVYASEMTVPYYAFQESGMHVDLASIRGGPIPVDPFSLRWPLRTKEDGRYLADDRFQEQAKNSIPIADIDPAQYDLVFLAGGWGAAYDLGTSEILGEKIGDAYAAGVVLGSVCHGALGLLKATDNQGQPLLQGRRVTAVTNKQVRELGISTTPQHPETELHQAGALYESKSKWLDTLANLTLVDGRLVTGQNQNAGAETAHRMMVLLAKLEQSA